MLTKQGFVAAGELPPGRRAFREHEGNAVELASAILATEPSSPSAAVLSGEAAALLRRELGRGRSA